MEGGSPNLPEGRAGKEREEKRSSPQRFRKESMRAAKIGVGTCLFSRAASSQVSWAQVGLTAVFGMGTGVPPPPSAPTLWKPLRGFQSQGFVYPEN